MLQWKENELQKKGKEVGGGEGRGISKTQNALQTDKSNKLGIEGRRQKYTT